MEIRFNFIIKFYAAWENFVHDTKKPPPLFYQRLRRNRMSVGRCRYESKGLVRGGDRRRRRFNRSLTEEEEDVKPYFFERSGGHPCMHIKTVPSRLLQLDTKTGKIEYGTKMSVLVQSYGKCSRSVACRIAGLSAARKCYYSSLLFFSSELWETRPNGIIPPLSPPVQNADRIETPPITAMSKRRGREKK